MITNPAEDWQRLTEHYRAMCDGELLDLAANSADLTETAQQVLRNEMAIRGLDRPRPAREAPKGAIFRADAQWPRGDGPSDAGELGQESEPEKEFTWKTPLCECESQEQAWQIRAALEQAGIESWVEQPGSRYAMEALSPRVVVAADQLDAAREVAARPIPQDILDQFNQSDEEFEAPQCPSCGAEDPVLESVEPTNTWLCEACGEQWTEPVDPSGEEAEKTGR